MPQTKRTYTLPSDTLDRFEREVDPGSRSSVIARLIGSWLDDREKEALRRDIIEGCRDMWDEYLEVEREMHPLDVEVLRGVW